MSCKSAMQMPQQFTWCFVVFIHFMCFVTIETTAMASLQGEIDLLETTAMAHRSNLEQILTWKGRATYEVKDEIENDKGKVPMYYRKSSVLFLLDHTQKATRWNMKVEDYALGANMPDEVEVIETTNGMKKDNSFYQVEPLMISKEGQKINTLKIMSIENAVSAFKDSTFDPMWYLTRSGHNISKFLLFLHQKANSLKVSGKIKRNGDIVSLEISEGTLFNYYEFNLDKGGNLIKYIGKSKRGEDVYTWTYENIEDTWVPKMFEHVNIDRRHERLRRLSQRVEFMQHIINVPIDPCEFTLDKIGVTVGTPVTDLKMGFFYKYGGGISTLLNIDNIQFDTEPSVGLGSDSKAEKLSKFVDAINPKVSKESIRISPQQGSGSSIIATKTRYKLYIAGLCILAVLVLAVCGRLYLHKSRKEY
ncbi:MAG: hypothetical protein OEW48_12440 [Phycisphaerae bacterium]|nr:hypothetical protein [Phycisphaerae bacterium]